MRIALGASLVLAACQDDGAVNPESSEAKAEWQERIAEARAHAARKVAPHASEPVTAPAPLHETPSEPMASVAPTRARPRAHATAAHQARAAGASHGRATRPATLMREVVSDPGGPKIVEVRPGDAVAKIRRR